MDIKNKIAVVTGAANGIGLALVKKLLKKSATAIAMVDISENCESAAQELNQSIEGSKVISFRGDVTDPKFRSTVFSKMRDQFGPIQICVPAAGVVSDALAVKVNQDNGDVDLYDEDIFKRILDINLVHPTYWAMETIAGIARQRQINNQSMWQADEEIQGVIILVGSVSSRGNRGQVSYAATKSGLIGVSATLNAEGLYHGVQTKIIHPGFVDTAMVESIDEAYFEKNLKSRIGLGRKISPDEIANIVCAMIKNPVISGEVWADASLTPLV